MKMNLVVLCASLISLSGCATHVVPQRGPTMEQIYDAAGRETNEGAYRKVCLRPVHVIVPKRCLTANTVQRDFIKLPNPELTLYVFPHLAGNDAVPIPGYETVFNVYEHDHYLPRGQWTRNT